MWLGIKVPGSCPDSQYLAVAQPGSAAGFVCQAAAGGGREGEPRACGGRRARLSQCGDQPSCLSPGNMEMGVKPGRWEAGMLGKGADREQGSQSPKVTRKQLFFVWQWRHYVQILQHPSWWEHGWTFPVPIWAMPASPQVIILLSPSCSISVSLGLSPGPQCSQGLS